jgi:two-component system, LytTR family, sensor histidine kinase AlgZ
MMAEGQRTLGRMRLSSYFAAAVAGTAVAVAALLLSRDVAPSTAVLAALAPSLVLGLAAVAAGFPCRALPLRTSSVTRIAITHLASAAAASGLWIVVWQWWIATMGIAIILDVPLLFAFGALLYLLSVVVHYLTLEIEGAREAEEAALRYRVMAREAELRAFKAQVDPHFLFNSLNAVSALCGSRPDQAREMSQLLADFFRQSLRVGTRETITLAEEADLAVRYLAIERIRFGERLSVNVSVDDEAAEAVVPPLILQPLVENAVRHGVSSVLEGGTISLLARTDNGVVRIVIENPADPERIAMAGEGIGLQNVRGRLGAFYSGDAALRTSEGEGTYRVEIEVPR